MTDDTAEPLDAVATCRRQRAEIKQLRAELDAAKIEITELRRERTALVATVEQAREGFDVVLMRVRREP